MYEVCDSGFCDEYDGIEGEFYRDKTEKCGRLMWPGKLDFF